MGKIIEVVLYHKESDYCSKLTAFLKEHCEVEVDFRCFFNMDILEAYLESTSNSGIERILFLPEDMKEITRFIKGNEVVVLLTETKGVLKVSIEGIMYAAIYKYQKAGDILKDILDICAKEFNAKEYSYTRKQGANVIGVFSPWDGLDDSGLFLAASFTEENKNVIYIDTEEFNWDFQDGKYSLTELLYFLQTEEGRFDMKLAAVVENIQGVDVIRSPNNPEDIRFLQEDVFSKLLEKLQGRYDVIVINISSIINCLLEIFDMCDELYLKAPADAGLRDKVERFKRFLSSKSEANLSKIKEFQGKGLIN